MTSEIAIMNRKGVALAADSVGTLVRVAAKNQTPKSFDTLHKLFQLPNSHGVGVMFYGNADCMGIPMETLIRMYSGGEELPYLSDHVESFLNYLAKFNFSEEQFKAYVSKTGHRLVKRVCTKIDKEVEAELSERGSLTKQRITKITDRHFDESFELITPLAKDASVKWNHRKSLAAKYGSLIQNIAETTLKKRPISKAKRSKIKQWVIDACCINPDTFTGLVFAGFGEQEHFPGCIELDVKGVLGDQVISRQKSSQSIEIDNDVIIRPFAEADDVITFMKGMNHDVQTFIQRAQEHLLTQSLPDALAQALGKALALKPNQTTKVREIAAVVGGGADERFNEELRKLQSEEFTMPVFGATRHMTPDLLAKMAETLIDLVSFRQEMSISSETVGGPIDVAVITKCDGFMWAKRKEGIGIA
jgi:hypothetical protein